jgi:mannan endo-1,4-beta-mannosidase
MYLVAAIAAVTGATGCLRLKQPSSASSTTVATTYMDTSGKVQPPKIETTNQPNAVFEVDGKPFCFQGTNNYYFNRKNHDMVQDVIARAKRMGISVIRIWAYIDRGSLDNSVPPVDPEGRRDGIKDGTKEGYFTQYWDPERKQPAYNDGPTGLEAVDYALNAAREAGVKLMLVLTNNWRDYGGMDQYLTWYGLNKHHLFYTDERVRTAYKNWAAHLINRKNTVNGSVYKDDPTIFGWELANEPRIRNYRDFDAPDGWDLKTIPRWADEMSQYIHSLDPNHLVSVGDEGQFAEGKKNDFYLGKDGIDHKALLALKGIDFGTFHLYPETWSTGLRWSYDWVRDHLKAAFDAKKPTVLEEYGLVIRRTPGKGLDPGKPIWGEDRRLQNYRYWNDILLKGGGAGSMFWLLVGKQEDGTIYPDYDHFTVYEGEQSGDLIQEYAAKFMTEARACQLAPPAKQPPSPFVRVRHWPGPDAIARLIETNDPSDHGGWIALR